MAPPPSMASLARRCATTAARPKQLLLVWHSRTGLARQMSLALEDGALSASRQLGEKLSLLRLPAAQASAEAVLHADGYLFCAPENLASTSGAMLDFFHRSYYHMFSREDEAPLLAGRPVGIAVAAGSDGSAAARQMERICRGWRLRPVGESLIWRDGAPQTAEHILSPKVCPAEAEELCRELGGRVAATLLL
ncbi:hypothetical protein AB1Y20_010834 [Prymnesium parvum]|uniref:NADPH-dependent FMN reductase-like domain-containing protein n=1 Tax=Prymnesium parvum TaxID=97485 RepID=A0AB34IT82_PRYPA